MTKPGVPKLLIGDEVDVVFSKWDGASHWHSVCRYLGTDSFGLWLAILTGTTEMRPGARFTHDRPGVRLIPHDGYVATFYALPTDLSRLHTYVDIASVPTWSWHGSRPQVSAVDLDLDVVKLHNGRIYVDDADEFAEHQVSMHYPQAVIEQASDTCARVLQGVTAQSAPFNHVAQQWLSQVDSLS